MGDVKRVEANWSLELWLHCPHCDGYQNLLDNPGYDKDDGGRFSHVERYSESDLKEDDEAYECEDCGKEFAISCVGF